MQKSKKEEKKSMTVSENTEHRSKKDKKSMTVSENTQHTGVRRTRKA